MVWSYSFWHHILFQCIAFSLTSTWKPNFTHGCNSCCKWFGRIMSSAKSNNYQWQQAFYIGAKFYNFIHYKFTCFLTRYLILMFIWWWRIRLCHRDYELEATTRTSLSLAWYIFSYTQLYMFLQQEKRERKKISLELELENPKS